MILSPGAEPVRPPIPGADSPGVFTLRNLADIDRIKQAVDQLGPGRAVIVGGGYIGLEMAEALRHRGIDVTLVELAKQVFVAADPEMVAPIHQQLELHGVDLRLGTSVTAIAREGDRLGVLFSDGESVEAALVILAVGVRPETTLAREGGLEIGPTGGIAVDRHMRTSDPSIFAVGDAVEVTRPRRRQQGADSAGRPGQSPGPHRRRQRPGPQERLPATARARRSARSSIWRSA